MPSDSESVKPIIAIPARLGASRLPGKPLRDIAGKPLIAHVIARAQAFGAADVVVATDDNGIAAVAREAGVQVCMTGSEHATGSDRLAEVAQRLAWPDQAIVINLQGDEPLMPLACLHAVMNCLRQDPQAAAATLATPITGIDEVFDPNCVKLVRDVNGRALYFSRAPLPWARDAWSGDSKAWVKDGPWLRHLGLYAYRAATLRRFAELERTPLERVESLEQLRLLENGLPIAVALAPEPIPAGVDTEADLQRVARILARPRPLRVLFVCLGNICRSPLSAAYARQRADEMGLALHIESAGTLSYHSGEQADAGTFEIAARLGLDISGHRARQVRPEDFTDFDHVLAHDAHNLMELGARCPPALLGKVRRLMDFAPASGHRDVPDPYGGGPAAFDRSFDCIRDGVDGLLKELARRSPQRSGE